MPINHHHFDVLDSTQNRAREFIQDHAELPLLVTAEVQTAGRGRQGRTWESPSGNFHGSFVLRPPVQPSHYHEYSFLSALALREVIIEGVPNRTVTFKWPNDILLDGAKCAGILIESDGEQNEFLIIGIGVNLYRVPDHPLYPAAALWPDRAPDPLRFQVFAYALGEALLAWHEKYIAGGFGLLRDAWLAHAHGLGTEITVKTPVAEISGSFAGIDEKGTLLLTHGDETIKVTTADVLL